jgi:hypothetical protein
MPRLEAIVSEIPLSTVGAIRGVDGSFGAKWNAQGADFRHMGFVPAKPQRKRPCCKTCNGGACVGQCKF